MPTDQQLADIFTKILPSSQQQHLHTKFGMVSHHSSLRRGEESEESDDKLQHNNTVQHGTGNGRMKQSLEKKQS